jgi:CRP-like cAMP-binding protein
MEAALSILLRNCTDLYERDAGIAGGGCTKPEIQEKRKAHFQRPGVSRFRRCVEKVFFQGDPADSVLYIQKGGVKLSVINESGKGAVVAMMGPGDFFFGEGCLAGYPVRMGMATAITSTSLLVIEKNEMHRLLHHEHALSDRFITHLLSRNAGSNRI